MRAPLLLPLALLALLSNFARAEAPREESPAARVRSFTQQAVRSVQERLAALRQSEAGQKAREWLESGLEKVQQFLRSVKDKIPPLRTEAAPGS
ncbi:apolipoprotein C-III-like [Elgaria multicarinata webbii]|uniref:apolipoprotein C-III-like n=1 Tax=Elgaria multicarinata webbii TaxID=159646 RepID=UPI002FCCBC42